MFPVVTFCNQNRFRKSKQHLGGDHFTSTLDHFKDKLREQMTGSGHVNARHKRNIEYGSSAKETNVVHHRVKRAPGSLFLLILPLNTKNSFR